MRACVNEAALNAKPADLVDGTAKFLLLIATLVASLAKQLAVLLLRHTLATLLDY